MWSRSLRIPERPAVRRFDPCLPRPAKQPPAGPGWIYEIKHDGFRILAHRNGDRVRLVTRNGYDFAATTTCLAISNQIDAFVGHYNHVRYHESINNLTPADVYFGRAETILAERERIKRATISNRRLQHQLKAA